MTASVLKCFALCFQLLRHFRLHGLPGGAARGHVAVVRLYTEQHTEGLSSLEAVPTELRPQADPPRTAAHQGLICVQCLRHYLGACLLVGVGV